MLEKAEEDAMLHEPITMPESEQTRVEELRRILQLGDAELIAADGKERTSLPPSIYRVLKDAVKYLQRGRSISIVREDEELTTQLAANFLGMSRPHLVKLLESGALPFHKTGSHRRVLFSYLVRAITYLTNLVFGKFRTIFSEIWVIMSRLFAISSVASETQLAWYVCCEILLDNKLSRICWFLLNWLIMLLRPCIAFRAS
jgi:excisionase family DNA binding protein